jgi:DNA-directed RNA polymerases I and III subunit RPAC2
MSVNEVRQGRAAHKLVVLPGTEQARTFALGNEDHTLGNAVRHVLLQDESVTFTGYSVPHPAEPVVHIRVQTNHQTTATAALRSACNVLASQCDIVLEKLEEILPEVQEDRVRMEQLLLAEEEDEDTDEGDNDEEEDEVFVDDEDDAGDGHEMQEG